MNVDIPNIKKYNAIIDNMCLQWKENIHILADFDKTLTRAFIKWKSFPSLISILRNDERILWKQYAKKAHDLYNYYSVIEKDPQVKLVDKIEIMSQWWRKHQELLIESWLTQQHIKQAINSGYLEFRDWIEEFIKILEKNNIPLVIISANWIWWDSIKMFFEKHGLMSANIHIISNVLKFDDNWVTCWFENKVIHSFNKTEAVISDYPEIHKKIQNRKNVILMWDSLGDPQMIDGFDWDNVLKIWFFNEDTSASNEKLYRKFEESYDVIIKWDWNLNFVNKLLKNIK